MSLIPLPARFVVIAISSALLTVHGGCAPPKPPQRLVAHKITGRVLCNGQSVADARVRIKGSAPHVITDRLGRFTLTDVPRESVITAAGPQHIIGSTQVTDPAQELQICVQPLPAHDHPQYAWVDPRPNLQQPHQCGNCHRQIFDEWSKSGHAQAATNPRTLQLITGQDAHGTPNRGWGLVQEHPFGAGVCQSCHAPAASDHELAQGLDALGDVSRQGVHCDFCHKVQDVAMEGLGITHGRYAMKVLRPHTDQLFFGPLDDVDRGEDAFSPLQQESRFCASCHDGTIFGVPVYQTYSEWLASPARQQGKQCQSCHMTPDGTLRNIAPHDEGIDRDPDTLASHAMLPGGRSAMLRRSLQVEVQIERQSTSCAVGVTLTPKNVGHRLPTGFVDRHLILHVEGFAADGLPVSPLTDQYVLPAATGDGVAGRPGRLFAKLLMGPGHEYPIPFWGPVAQIEDTRLLPEQSVVTQFEFPPDIRQAQVRVLYRRFWSIVRHEKQWPDDTEIVYDRRLGIE